MEIVIHDASKAIKWVAPRVWNGPGRLGVGLAHVGWEAGRAGALSGSARVWQGIEIAAVGISWLARRAFYHTAVSYNASRLPGNIAYGNRLLGAPYRPRPGGIPPVGPGGMPAWADSWPTRRWAAPGLRFANASSFHCPDLPPKYVHPRDRPDIFDPMNIYKSTRPHSLQWHIALARHKSQEVAQETERLLNDYLTPLTDATQNNYVDVNGNVLGPVHTGFAVNPPPYDAFKHPDLRAALTSPNQAERNKAYKAVLDLSTWLVQLNHLRQSEELEWRVGMKNAQKIQNELDRVHAYEDWIKFVTKLSKGSLGSKSSLIHHSREFWIAAMPAMAVDRVVDMNDT